VFQTTDKTPSGRSTRAISGRARSGSNQWNAVPAATTSTEELASGIRSAAACRGRDAGNRGAQLGQHGGGRVGCDDLMPEPGEGRGQLAGAGAQLEDARSPGPGQPAHRLDGVARPALLVDVGNGAEDQALRGWCRRLVHRREATNAGTYDARVPGDEDPFAQVGELEGIRRRWPRPGTPSTRC
jgi:hypothetical protein